jgi:hypothetical protein
MLLKTRREEGHQFVNLLPDRYAQFVIIQWITCVIPKLGNLLMHSVKKRNFLFYCSNIAKSKNAMLWRMLSRLETCIVYSCIWSVTLAKSIVPRKTAFKNPTGRRASVREVTTRQICTICDYTVDYMCHTKTRKSPHAFVFLTKMQVIFSIFFHHGSLNVIGDKFRFVRSKLKSR